MQIWQLSLYSNNCRTDYETKKKKKIENENKIKTEVSFKVKGDLPLGG
jgi:hypothetical protein